MDFDNEMAKLNEVLEAPRPEGSAIDDYSRLKGVELAYKRLGAAPLDGMTPEESKAFQIRLVSAEVVGLARQLRTAETNHFMALDAFMEKKRVTPAHQHMTLMNEWAKRNDVLLKLVTKAQDRLDAGLKKLDAIIEEAV